MAKLRKLQQDEFERLQNKKRENQVALPPIPLLLTPYPLPPTPYPLTLCSLARSGKACDRTLSKLIRTL